MLLWRCSILIKFNDSCRLVSVLCGAIPFTLVSDQAANVEGGVNNYRMRMIFRTIKPVLKGELLTIGRGGSAQSS